MSLPLQEVQLQDVLKRTDIWQASQKSVKNQSITTVNNRLDELLHLSGWPLNRLSEILIERFGIGEMQLILPSVAKIMQNKGWLFLIEPPFMPYAPAWLKAGIDIDKIRIIKSCEEKDYLWAAEQIIANQANACCLFWPPKDHLSNKVLKRLQLAAEKGCQLNFVFRSIAASRQSSPASLRLIVNKYHSKKNNELNLAIKVVKQSGGWSGQETILTISSLLGEKQQPISEGEKIRNRKEGIVNESNIVYKNRVII